MSCAFFDLQDEQNEYFGRIVIKVENTSLYTKNFLELCLGIHASSYIGSFFWRKRSLTGFRAGEIELERKGVPPVIQVSSENVNTTCPKEKDVSVLFLEDYSIFFIATQNYNSQQFHIIGNIVEGYDLI